MVTISRRFENICTQHADLPAVKTGSETISYGELNARANQLARRIRQATGDEGNVGLLLEHGISLCVGILGCLKANKVYVPLDLNNPACRQEHIIQDAGISTILTDGSADVPIPELNQIDTTASHPNTPANNLNLSPRQDGHAFVLYTSGSTGRPKGVINNHSAIVARIADFNRFSVGPGDRITALGPGGMNLYRALLTGATLVSINLMEVEISALAGWMERENITIYHSVPTVFRHLVASLKPGNNFRDLRIVNLTGETLLSSDIDAFRKYFPRHCCLVNGLGTTEAGTFSELRIDHNSTYSTGVAGVGRSVEGTEVMLFDVESPTEALCEEGEIVVFGDHLSPGYWNRPNETKQKFINLNGRHGYRTGDLGKWESKTNLIHLGRIDRQIKIHGHRIEMGEIEVTLIDHPAVREVAVVGRKQKGGMSSQIYAYLVLNPGSTPSETDIKQFIRERLPEYFVPVRVLFLKELPLTPNGKVDRQALPEPGSKQTEPPVVLESVDFDKYEQEVLSIWREFLHNPNLLVTENFFEVGGNSMVALQIMNKIYAQLGAELPISTIFVHSDVVSLTHAILQDKKSLNSPPQS